MDFHVKLDGPPDDVVAIARNFLRSNDLKALSKKDVQLLAENVINYEQAVLRLQAWLEQLAARQRELDGLDDEEE